MNKDMIVRVLLAGRDMLSGPLKAASREATQARAALKAARDEVKQLERAQRDLAVRRDLSQRLDDHRVKLEAQKRVVEDLRRAFEATDRPTRQLTANFDAARGKLERLTREEDEHVDKLRAVEARLRTAGLETGDFGEHQERLRQRIETSNAAIREQQRELAELAARQRRQQEVNQNFADARARSADMMAGGATALGVGAAIAAPALGGAALAEGYEADLVTIAQRSDLTAEATDRLGQRILAAGAAANQTRQEMTAIVDELTAQGDSADDALVRGAAVARAATAYGEAGQDIARAAGSLRNLNMAASDTARGLDIMAAAGKEGNFEFGDMARAFPSLTSSAARFGMEGPRALAELAAAAQIARTGAGSSEEAATNLNNLLQKIGSPQTAKNFAKMGINLTEALAAGEASGKSALETIIELTQRATRGDASRLGYLFEDAQVQKALLPLMRDLDEFSAMRERALGADGVVDRDFQRRMEASAEATKALRIAADRAAISFGEHVRPALDAGKQAVTDLLDAFADFSEENPNLVRTLAIGSLVIAGLVATVGALAVAAGAVLIPLAGLKWAIASLGLTAAGTSGLLAGAFGALRAASVFLLTNPIGLALTAIGVAGYLIYRNWSRVGPVLGAVWSGIKSGAAAAFGLVNRLFLNFHPLGFIVRNWQPITRLVGSIFNLVKEVVGLGLDYVKLAILRFTPLGFIIRNWGPISGFVSTLWTGVTSGVGLAITTIKNVLANFKPLNDIKAAFAAVWTYFRDLPGRFFQAGADAVNGLVRGVRGHRAAVQEETRRVAAGMVETTRREHDTNSPSRVFATLGQNAMEGLALGVRGGGRSPVDEVRRAAAAMAAAGVVSLGAAGVPSIAAASGSAAPAPVINIDVTVVAQPGQSAEQLGEAIAAAVAQAVQGAAPNDGGAGFDDPVD
jgi:TP901 family phage tail tape measure protein